MRTVEQLEAIVADLASRVEQLEARDHAALTARSRAPHVRGSSTSRRAAVAVEPRTGTQKRRILDYLVDQADHGATRQEIATELDMSDDSVRPRIVELIDGGWVTVSNFTRATPLGEQAEVLIATVHARREAPLRREQVRQDVSPSPVLADESGRLLDLGAGERPVPGSSASTGRPSMYDPLGDAA